MNAESPGALASRFEADYVALRRDKPHLGQIGILPSDSEIFGFRVAEYRAGSPEVSESPASLAEELERWALENGVELIGSCVPADSTRSSALLESAGFRFVELQTRATRTRLHPDALARCRLTVRSAEPADHRRIVEIADSAFAFGRYHADPGFPRGLANRRYRIWMERALSNPSPGTWIGVAGPPGRVLGFLHAEQERDQGDIRLMAVDPGDGILAGPDLFLGALRELAARGTLRVTARLSASNSAVLNIYASLAFRFHEPEIVLHWHRPGAPHLFSPADTAKRKGADGSQRPC